MLLHSMICQDAQCWVIQYNTCTASTGIRQSAVHLACCEAAALLQFDDGCGAPLWLYSPVPVVVFENAVSS